MMDGSYYTDDPLDVGWHEKPLTRLSFVGMIRRQAATIIFCVVASIAAALLLIVYSVPMYTARVALYVDAEGGAGELRSDAVTAIDLDTNVELIRSDDTTAAVIRALDLGDEPLFELEPSAVGDLVHSLRIRLGLVPPEIEAVDPLQGVIRNVRAGLDVARSGNTRVIDVRYTSWSPELSVAIANAFAQTHLDRISERDERTLTRKITRLDSRAEDLRLKAAMADDRIRTILSTSVMVATDPTEIERQITALRQQHSALQSKGAALSTKLSVYAEYGATGDVSTIPIDTPEVTTLLAEMDAAQNRLDRIRLIEDVYPQTVSMIEEVIENQQDGLRQVVRRAARAIEVERDMTASEQVNIANQIANLGSYLSSDAGAELTTLREKKVLYDNMYQDYLKLLEGAGREKQGRPEIRIVSDALMPTTPSSPNIKVVLAIAMTLAIFIGICIAAMREWNRYEQAQS